MSCQQVLDPNDVTSARQPDRPQPHILPSAVRQFGYVPDFDDWLPGDLLLFSTSRPNLLQQRIVNTQAKLKYAGEDARWHHAAVYIGDRYLCEARPGGVRYHPVVETINPHTMLRVRKDNTLTQPQRFRLAIRALMRLSQPYSYSSIFRAFFRPLNPWRFVLALRPRERALICSQLFHEAYMEATGSILFERADIAVVPAELSAIDSLQDVKAHWVRLADTAAP